MIVFVNNNLIPIATYNSIIKKDIRYKKCILSIFELDIEIFQSFFDLT